MILGRTIRPIRYRLEGLAYRLTGHPLRLAQLKNRFANQPMLVVGNGPSLNSTPLDEFVGVPAIGMNKIDLLFPRVKWRPSLIICMNRHVMAQHQDRYAAIEIPVYLSWQSRWFIRTKNRGAATYFLDLADTSFSTDITRGVGISGTVTYAALQFAFYTGADPVILLGVDHSFAVTGPANKLVVSHGDDQNHFDPNYFGNGIKWNLPDLVESERGYSLARKAFEAHGRKIWDATLGGKLQAFERIGIVESMRFCRR